MPALAIALAGRGLRMAYRAYPPGVDGQPSYDDRAIALAYGSSRIFDAMIVWPAMRGSADRSHDIHVSGSRAFRLYRLAAEDGRAGAAT